MAHHLHLAVSAAGALAWCYLRNLHARQQSASRALVPTTDIDAAAAARLRAYLRSAVESRGLAPGVSLVVSRHGVVVFDATFGFARLAGDGRIHGDSAGGSSASTPTPCSQPLTPSSILRFFSMTKPMTSVAILQLEERGLLRLDDLLSRHVPEWDDAAVRVCVSGSARGGDMVTAPAERPITLRMLLTHSSGLDYGFWSDALSPVSLTLRERGLELPLPITNHCDADTTNYPPCASLREFVRSTQKGKDAEVVCVCVCVCEVRTSKA